MMKWGAVFPGQGSQHVGMGKFLYDNFAICRERFEEASDRLQIDFQKLCFDGPEDQLQLTQNTQPALLLISTCYHQVLQNEMNFSAQMAAGHSIGEYAALVATEALQFSDAILAVRKRGQAMQQAVPVGKGAMLAVMGLNPGQVHQLCQWAVKESGHSPLEPANYNTPEQTVVSGHQKAVQWLSQNFTTDIFDSSPRKAKLVLLKVSAPFHCSLMKPAEDQMRQILEDIPFWTAQSPVVQNVNAQPTTKASKLRENLIQQISRPVRWVECVQTLIHEGSEQCVELGSGKVLSGLIKKIDRNALKTFNINSLEDLKTLQKHQSPLF